jgi:hypothetical protein
MTADWSVESALRRFAGASSLGELGGVQRFNPCDEEALTRRSPQPAGSAGVGSVVRQFASPWRNCTVCFSRAQKYKPPRAAQGIRVSFWLPGERIVLSPVGAFDTILRVK